MHFLNILLKINIFLFLYKVLLLPKVDRSWVCSKYLFINYYLFGIKHIQTHSRKKCVPSLYVWLDSQNMFRVLWDNLKLGIKNSKLVVSELNMLHKICSVSLTSNVFDLNHCAAVSHTDRVNGLRSLPQLDRQSVHLSPTLVCRNGKFSKSNLGEYNCVTLWWSRLSLRVVRYEIVHRL